MVLRPLRVSQSPDLPDVLLHMTGRQGRRGPGVRAEVANLTPVQRLANILWHSILWYSPPFDGAWPVVCLSQMTRTALGALTPSRYQPTGLAFHKQAVFDGQGGPALYVRGDEYDALRESGLAPSFLARAVRYWPGREAPFTLEEALRPQSEMTQSEWALEREWRIPRRNGTEVGWTFTPAAVAFLVLGSAEQHNELLAILRTWGGVPPWVGALPCAYATAEDPWRGPWRYVGVEDLWP